MNLTEHYSLQKPISEEKYDIKVANMNMDLIDSALNRIEQQNNTQDSLMAAQEDLDSEIARAIEIENQLLKNINDEITRAEGVESEISNQLDYEITRAMQAEDIISDDLSELTARLNALADSDDTTLDQLSEIVTYIKNNKSLIDSITTNKVNVSDIVDNLTSTATNKPLSAKQGKVVKDLIDALTTTVGNKVDKVTGKGLSTNDYTTTEKNKLSGIAAGAEVNVQPDWNVTDSTSDAFIKNKPTSLPASDVSAWAKEDNKPSYSKSDVGLGNVPNVSTNDQTPTFTQATTRTNIASGEKLSILFGKIMKWFADLKAVAFTGSYNDLLNKPTIPTSLPANGGTAKTISDVLTIAKGGTGKTTANAAANMLINSLTDGTDGVVLTDDTIYITKNLNKDVDTYHKRKMSTLWSYIKSKAESVFVKKSGDTMTGNLLIKKDKARVVATNSDESKTVWMGIGDSGVNHGVYSPTLEKWLVYADNSKIYLNGNADSANKDKNGNDIVNTYYTKSDANNLNVKKKYTINLNSYANTNFYLVTFNNTRDEIDCEIHSQSANASAAYNQNVLHFLLTRQGWNDTPKRFIILNHGVFSESEITIASIVSGDHNGNNGIYLRGGLIYEIYSNIPVTLRTSQYTGGDEIFPSGTPTCYKIGFTNVSVLMDFTASGNTGGFAGFDTELRAVKFKGNADSATKLQTARTIDGVSFDGSAAITHYGTCTTAAATAAKAVTCTGFTLVTGAEITVKFTTTNTAANPTLNVNGTGAKAIQYRGTAIAAGYLAANRTYRFLYDGTYYQLIGDINTDTNTTYSAATQSANGLMSAADKKKLDGIAAGANAYSLPLATASVRGGTKIGYAANGKNYPVQLSNEQMYVNVPWTDTTYLWAHLELSGVEGSVELNSRGIYIFAGYAYNYMDMGSFNKKHIYMVIYTGSNGLAYLGKNIGSELSANYTISEVAYQSYKQIIFSPTADNANNTWRLYINVYKIV